jgi:hypothetical protein
MTLLPHADPAGVKDVPTMGGRVFDESMSSTDPPTRPHSTPPLVLDVVERGPQSALLSLRWRQGENVSILEILDAALEIAGEGRQHTNKTNRSLSDVTHAKV